MKDGGDRHGVGQHASGLAHAAIRVDGPMLPRVEQSIPVGHVRQDLIDLRARIFELGKAAAGVKVVVVLVGLPEDVAVFDVVLVVVCPVLFRAVGWDPAVWTLEADVRRGLRGRC